MELSAAIQVMMILAGSVVLFVSDRVRVDLVAMLVLLALLLTGIVPERHILDGFSSPATMTIAAMFIISAGLQRTGIVRFIANRLHVLVGQGKERLTGVLMVTCGFFSAFTNNTATVAVLLPVSLRLAQERNINASRVLMPLSFAAQFGGVCTLVGTTTNLLVNAVAIDAGREGFSMFEFAQLGIVCFFVGTVYMVFASKYLLKDRAGTSDATAEYRLKDYMTEMRVLEGSPLIGQKGGENDLTELGDETDPIRLLEIIRDDRMIWAPQATEIQENDLLLLRGDVGKVMESEGLLKIEDWAEGNLNDVHLEGDDVTLVEVVVPGRSNIIGRTLTQLDFYWRYHAAVLGVRRHGEVLHERIAKIDFKEGDTLLLQGHKQDLMQLADEKDFMLLQDLSVLRLKKRRSVIAFMILLWVILAASTGFLTILAASLIGAIGMIVTRCLSASEAYESLDFKVIVLLAALIPLGTAMQTTHMVDMAVDFIILQVGQYGPTVAMAVIYLLAMVLTALMSNAATAVLLAPLALAIADGFAVDPKPFLMAVAFAASTCFSTPVGYQTNIMVYGPGGYKYVDFLKVGLPLNIIFFAISVTLIPLFWPF
ncbi:MAG: di/tricarboxylate transporter [Alphaproteobacteria bacterium]|jgi:di/tricarboxylate transporter